MSRQSTENRGTLFSVKLIGVSRHSRPRMHLLARITWIAVIRVTSTRSRDEGWVDASNVNMPLTSTPCWSNIHHFNPSNLINFNIQLFFNHIPFQTPAIRYLTYRNEFQWKEKLSDGAFDDLWARFVFSSPRIRSERQKQTVFSGRFVEDQPSFTPIKAFYEA